MRQSILVVILVFVVVLSAHYSQVTRANVRAERALHDRSLLSVNYDDLDDETRDRLYHSAIAAAKD